MKLRLGLFLVGVFYLLLGCAPTAQQAKTTTEGEYAKEMRVREPELPKCDRPLGTIVARSFKCKAAQCIGNRIVFGPNYTVQLSPRVLGEGLSDMLVTALVNTGCFKVLERETLAEIKEELELMGVKPKQTLKGADFLLTGAITALEMNASGVGGGGVVVPLPFLGGVGVKAGKQKAHIALDLRLVRVRDAEILLAKAVEGKSERWKFGIGGGGIFGTTIAGGWFEVFKNTPMEEAVRDLIYHTVKLIVERVKSYGPAISPGSSVPVTASPAAASAASPKPITASPVTTPPAASPKPERSVAAGGIRRAKQVFRHGDVVLWSEDFSTCRVIPKGIKIVRGTAECIEFGGKKWVATLKGDLVFEKSVPKFNPSKDWAIEFTAYLKGGKGSYAEGLSLFLGREGSPFPVELNIGGRFKVFGKELPAVRDANGNPVTIGLMKEGDAVSVFVNGERWGTVPVDPIALGRQKRKVVFRLFADDIETGDYAFVTDIKLSVFSK